MTNMTLAIPEELMEKMKKFSEIRWSEVASKAIEQRIEDLEVMNKITSRNKFTQKDIDKLSKKIKKGIAKRHGLL